MVCTRVTEEVVLDVMEASTGRGRGQATHANALPPPPRCALVSLEQLLATQNDLMTLLMENDTRRGAESPHPRK
jgi:hypothetical protein